MIEHYQNEDLSKVQQEKVEIFRWYHRYMLKLYRVLEEMIEKLENLSQEN